MRFRARDLPKPVEPPVTKKEEVVQPIVVVQAPEDPGAVDDAVKMSAAKVLLTLREATDRIESKIVTQPRVKEWRHSIVRFDSGYIKEIISTPVFEDT